MTAPTRTTIVPPRLASLPGERAQLEYSSRSLVFAADGERLLRAWGPAERPWVVAVEPRGARWVVEAWGAEPPAARRAIRELFSLNDPLEAFYRRTRHEPVLRSAAGRFRGLRLPRDANLYESLLHAVIGQQLSVAAASAIKRRLFAALGEPLFADGIEVPCPPRPSRLVEAGPDGLRSSGLSRAKVRSLVRLAALVPGLDPDGRLGRIALDRARGELEQLPGVGRWTAENVLLRGIGRRDVFVAGDLGVRVALERYGVLPRSAPEVRARAWAEEHYPGWGSYATLYLWRRLVAERDRGAGP